MSMPQIMFSITKEEKQGMKHEPVWLMWSITKRRIGRVLMSRDTFSVGSRQDCPYREDCPPLDQGQVGVFVSPEPIRDRGELLRNPLIS